MTQTLQAPWRLDYLQSLGEADTAAKGCFLCQAAAESDDPAHRRRRLLIHSTPLTLVVMNKFPYTNGHLLIAPRRHIADLDALTSEESADLMRQTIRAIGLLRSVCSPQGFNVGINLGRCAGAGLPGHVHQHVVPRWAGDVNYISVIGEVRIVPRALSQLYDVLVGALAAPDPS